MGDNILTATCSQSSPTHCSNDATTSQESSIQASKFSEEPRVRTHGSWGHCATNATPVVTEYFDATQDATRRGPSLEGDASYEVL